jgi:hypothetical protein
MKFKEIILLGEMHGTEGNLFALQYLITLLQEQDKIISIGVELPVDWTDALSNIQTDEVQLRKLVHGSDEEQSGRVSEKHIQLFKKLSTEGIDFVPIREDSKDWNETDKKMSENILEFHKKSKSDVCIITLGNLHAKKETFEAFWDTDYKCKPVGELLNEVSTSILIRYKNTKYRNYDHVGVIDDELCTKREDGELLVREYQGDDVMHNYEICISDAGIV